MTGGQIALVVIGAMSLAESMWGIRSPGSLQAAVRRTTEDVPDPNRLLAAFFALLSVGLWFLMSPERSIVDYALLFLCWIFAGGVLVNIRQGAYQRVMSLLFLDRSLRAIRLLYIGEFVLACIIIGIGFSGG